MIVLWHFFLTRQCNRVQIQRLGEGKKKLSIFIVILRMRYLKNLHKASCSVLSSHTHTCKINSFPAKRFMMQSDHKHCTGKGYNLNLFHHWPRFPNPKTPQCRHMAHSGPWHMPTCPYQTGNMIIFYEHIKDNLVHVYRSLFISHH